MKNEVVIPREQIKDRTLTLTHQQFQLLQDALNIAELTCNDMFKMANTKFKSEADKSAALYYFEKGNKIYAFATDLATGEFDV